jgi:hypothetical protein
MEIIFTGNMMPLQIVAISLSLFVAVARDGGFQASNNLNVNLTTGCTHISEAMMVQLRGNIDMTTVTWSVGGGFAKTLNP